MTKKRLEKLNALPVWGAEELKEVQAFLGLTNAELAVTVGGVSLRTVELWRQGKNPVSKPAKVLLHKIAWFKLFYAS